MKPMVLIALGCALMLSTARSDAGLFAKSCASSDDGCSGCNTSCNPEDYRCQLEVATETIEKKCYNVEAEPICIPPITTSPFDCLRKKFRGETCCDAGCCDGESCDSGCDSCSSGGLFSCFKRGCGRIRCVNKLSKETYEDGEKCVCEWSAVPKCSNDSCCTEGCCD